MVPALLHGTASFMTKEAYDRLPKMPAGDVNITVTCTVPDPGRTDLLNHIRREVARQAVDMAVAMLSGRRVAR